MNNRRISNAFEKRFSDLEDLETDCVILSNHISVNVEVVPQKYQMELTDFQCNSVLGAKFENVVVKTFYQYVGASKTV